ncbi:uncharacterized protein LOC125497828 [Beta vulgaris subsp. vulgaris]|uniref:uncharacterized protein LOC125497828 n=1 Tax=Beta vulgaris subsp. vulgaris TaxID=3555 RepID=UPI0020374B2E|nr:uncharacterized protein LOC125497828 [Beta vulgaris subsp. vulgaris]
MIEQQELEHVHWDHMVWNRINTPKHRFISWLAIQSRLCTKEKLAQFGVSNSDTCCICEVEAESHAHLFFQCDFSRRLLSDIKQWMGITSRSTDLVRLQQWIHHSQRSKFKRNVWYASLAAAIYFTWQCRNKAYWDKSVPNPRHVFVSLKQSVKQRVVAVMPQNVSRVDQNWFVSL